MTGPSRLARPWLGVVVALVVVWTAGSCGIVEARFDEETRTQFEVALTRVAATDETRAGLEFGDAEAITALAATSSPKDVWGKLYGFGVSSVAPHTEALWSVAGIDLRSADYLLTAGMVPRTASLIVGGQNERRIDERLLASGWRRLGHGRTAPPLSLSGNKDAVLTIALGSVKTIGADSVAYGPKDGNIDAIVQPTQQTLAKDAEFKAFADCLGDVLAAQLVRYPEASGDKPRAIAVGVRRTTDRQSTPRAVICTGWASKNDADDAVGRQRDALRDGESIKGRPYAELYRNHSVEPFGKDRVMVRSEAETPGNAATALIALTFRDLPGLTAA